MLAKKPGRPPGPVDRERYSLILGERTVDLFRELGDGNLSRGARTAAELIGTGKAETLLRTKIYT